MEAYFSILNCMERGAGGGGVIQVEIFISAGMYLFELRCTMSLHELINTTV